MEEERRGAPCEEKTKKVSGTPGTSVVGPVAIFICCEEALFI